MYVLGYMTPYSLVTKYQLFERTWCVYLHGVRMSEENICFKAHSMYMLICIRTN
jgi:hypothetical protein